MLKGYAYKCHVKLTDVTKNKLPFTCAFLIFLNILKLSLTCNIILITFKLYVKTK